jgi:outer membrane protein OmpA-like peptidoglycan-associated protein
MTKNKGPIIGLGLLLGAAAGVTPLLVHRVIEPDIRRATTSWLADAGASHVVVERVDGQDITLRGPANEENLAIESLLRQRGTKHWIESIKYFPERNPDTGTTPSTTVAARIAVPTTVVVASTIAAPTETAAPAVVAAAPLPAPAPATGGTALGAPPAKPSCPTGLPLLDGNSFAAGAAALTDAAKATLDQLAALLKGAQGCSLTVGGHTDSRGDDSYNQLLSQDRANAVRTYLVAAGVSADRLKAVGFGETKPKVSPEVSDGDRAANRRIEFTPNNAAGS